MLVIAKAPVAGLSKTRLCPPCSPGQAAELAEAALADTLDAVAKTDCAERILVLEGTPGDWLPEGFRVVPQVGGGLGDRLAGAFAAVDGPAFLIGMDTPQVDSRLLSESLDTLEKTEDQAVLGFSDDGGYWAIGFKRPVAGAFEHVPMSTDRTGQAQLERLDQLGVSVNQLPVMRDVDFFEDARQVALQCPGGRFARAFREMESSLCPG